MMAVRNKITVIGLGAAALATAALSLSSAVATADVTEVAPSTHVSSDKLPGDKDDPVRSAKVGEVLGQGVTRESGRGVVCAQGQVRGSMKAVAGTKAAPFGVGSNGGFSEDAPVNDW